MSAQTDAAIIERAMRFASLCKWTIDLQIQRIESAEHEDRDFPLRNWVDLQFLLATLSRLRRAARLASRTQQQNRSLQHAIDAFDRALPHLKSMRDINEHFDVYALDDPKRHDKAIDRRQLEVGTWDGETFTWLARDGHPLQLHIAEAKQAATDLYLCDPHHARCRAHRPACGESRRQRRIEVPTPNRPWGLRPSRVWRSASPRDRKSRPERSWA